MIYGGPLIRCLGFATLLALAPARPAHATALIRGLADVNFGTINSFVDQSNTQNVSICSFQGFATAGYSVMATGSGSGGAFSLSSGANKMAYDVQWADSANRTSGTMLQPGVAAGGFNNAASLFACFGQPVNASLIVTIRSAQLTSATAGSYSGTLQIMIVPD